MNLDDLDRQQVSNNDNYALNDSIDAKVGGRD
jgi:hypothetical protein